MFKGTKACLKRPGIGVGRPRRRAEMSRTGRVWGRATSELAAGWGGTVEPMPWEWSASPFAERVGSFVEETETLV